MYWLCVGFKKFSNFLQNFYEFYLIILLDNIVTSVKTVYEAASQEGWVYLMYNTTVRSWKRWIQAFIRFLKNFTEFSLIFQTQTRRISRLVWIFLFHFDDIFPCLARQKRFHRCDHWDFCRNEGPAQQLLGFKKEKSAKWANAGISNGFFELSDKMNF